MGGNNIETSGLTDSDKTVIVPPPLARGIDTTGTTSEIGTTSNGIPQDLQDFFLSREDLNYKLLSVIGVGGEGVVYLAQGKRGEKDILVVKVANTLTGVSLEDLVRYRGAGMKAKDASLQNPGVVKVHTYGFIPDATNPSSGRPYIVMEYVGGGSLQQYIDNPGKLTLDEKINRFMIPILETMSKVPMVHRDLKPSNILLTDKHEPKITDFGLAISRIDTTEIKDRRGRDPFLARGTPKYMALEQWEGGVIDHRTDIFALGIIFRQLLTGEHPYCRDGMSKDDIYNFLKQGKMPPTQAEDIPLGLCNILDRMTEIDQKRRYQSYEDILTDFRLLQESMLVDVQQPMLGMSNLNRDARDDIGLWDEVRRARIAQHWDFTAGVKCNPQGESPIFSSDGGKSVLIKYVGNPPSSGEESRTSSRECLISRKCLRLESKLSNVSFDDTNSSIDFFLLAYFGNESVDYTEAHNLGRVAAYNFRITQNYLALERDGIEVARTEINSDFFEKYKEGVNVVVEKVDDRLLFILGDNEVRLDERLTHSRPFLSRKFVGVRASRGAKFEVGDIRIYKERNPSFVDRLIDGGAYESALELLYTYIEPIEERIAMEQRLSLSEALEFGNILYLIGQINVELEHERKREDEIVGVETERSILQNAEHYFQQVVVLPTQFHKDNLSPRQINVYTELQRLASFAKYKLLQVAYERQDMKAYLGQFDTILSLPRSPDDLEFFTAVRALHQNVINNIEQGELQHLQDPYLRYLKQYSISINGIIEHLRPKQVT